MFSIFRKTPIQSAPSESKLASIEIASLMEVDGFPNPIGARPSFYWPLLLVYVKSLRENRSPNLKGCTFYKQ